MLRRKVTRRGRYGTCNKYFCTTWEILERVLSCCREMTIVVKVDARVGERRKEPGRTSRSRRRATGIEDTGRIDQLRLLAGVGRRDRDKTSLTMVAGARRRNGEDCSDSTSTDSKDIYRLISAVPETPHIRASSHMPPNTFPDRAKSHSSK